MSRLATTLIVLALLAGTAAAFAVAERLKLERSPVTAPRFTREFSPVCACETAEARLQLRFRRAAVVTASIADADGETIRLLAERERVRRGQHVYVWDGRDDAGQLVPDARYFLRLRFEDDRRSILLPVSIRVDTEPPSLEVLEARPETISPDGDGRRDRFKVAFRVSEHALPSIVVDGREAIRTRPVSRRERHGLKWGGTLLDPATGERVPAEVGDHVVELVVRDDAGNETRERFDVRLRFVDLDSDSYTVAAGARLSFLVDTDAESFSFSLHRARADGRLGRRVLRQRAVTDPAVVVEVPGSTRPGDYVLRVRQPGGEIRVPVVVEPTTG